MDMGGKLPIAEICKGLKKFTYEPLADRWGEFLLPVPPDYEEQLKAIVKVRCKRNFYDLERNRLVDADEVWEVTRKRAEVLEDIGVIDIIEG